MQLLKSSITVFAAILLFKHTSAANILCLMGVPFHSHQLWSEVLFKSLASRGHELTIVSSDISDVTIPNINVIYLEATNDIIEERKQSIREATHTFAALSAFKRMLDWYKTQMDSCKGILASEGFATAIELGTKNHKQYDVIIYDVTFGSGCLLSLANLFPAAPVVGLSAFKMLPEVFELARGGLSKPANVPFFTTNFDEQMSYWQRLQNSALYGMSYFYKHVVVYPVISAMITQNRHARLARLSTNIEELSQRIKVILVNTHPGIDYVQTLPPNVIEIGGMHIVEPKPLPDSMLKFIENSHQKGVVFMSLGSRYHTEVLGQTRVDDIVRVVRRLPEYNFIWKFENVAMIKDPPENLYISEWLPQNDILAHPNVHAFFTQGGGISLQEAIHHCVPVVMLPLEMDQFNNAHRICARGAGIELDFSEFNEVDFLNALIAVLERPQYKQHMHKLQTAFRTKPQPPLSTAIWWIEQISKHPHGLDHLISPVSANTSFFVSYSWDILLFVIVFITVLFINSYVITKQALQRFGTQKTKKENRTTSAKRSKVKRTEVKGSKSRSELKNKHE